MMSERIARLAKKTLAGEMYVNTVKTEFDRTDVFLSDLKRSAKRICEYILNQEPLITEDSCFTGLVNFDGSVEGDIFNRPGYPHFSTLFRDFYNRPIDNLLTFEWQHSVGNFGKIIDRGIEGIKEEISQSRQAHEGDADAIAFLDTQTDFCNAVIAYAQKCKQRVLEFSEGVCDVAKKSNLRRLAERLDRVPRFPAEGFYDAVLSLYFVYGYIPDSIGLIDRYLYPHYQKDIDCQSIDRDEAKEYLQELFLMLQARIPITSDLFYRGGASHFCVGGYTEDGEDGFGDLSCLIVEALMELPTYIPQISFRWTRKTPRDVFRFMMDCERKDANKRIAFVNDEPRIKGLMQHAGFSYKEAIRYTMMGCNEIAIPGGMVLGFDPFNMARFVERVLYEYRDKILAASDFEAFYSICQKALFDDLDLANEYGRCLQEVRNKDICVVSNIFIDGCIENARSITDGGGERYIAVGVLIGLTTVIDSLTVIKQFIYDDRTVSMEDLCRALDHNWQGYEHLRATILKKACFFGNNERISDDIAKRLLKSVEKWNDGNNYLKKKWLFGNLIGYNAHNQIFGGALKATPDGRYAGDAISFGIGQSAEKDRKGLTALLRSIATCDPDAILTGPSVTNVLLDEALIRNDCTFEKLVDLFVAYFKEGGTHFQLTYVSKEDLIAAKKTPDAYRGLRVRVSGFSDYFAFLEDDLQNEIIERTVCSN